MAPVNTTPKPQRSATKATKKIKSKSSPKKAITAKKSDKIPLKRSNTSAETRQRTSTVPKVNTPKCKETKPALVPPSSVKKSTWKQRPKPAHTGVPVPAKLKALKSFDFDDSF